MKKILMISLLAALCLGIGGCSKDDSSSSPLTDAGLTGYWVNSNAVKSIGGVSYAAEEIGYVIGGSAVTKNTWSIYLRGKDGLYYYYKTFLYYVKGGKVYLSGNSDGYNVSLSGDVMTFQDPLFGNMTMKKTSQLKFGATYKDNTDASDEDTKVSLFDD